MAMKVLLCESKMNHFYEGSRLSDNLFRIFIKNSNVHIVGTVIFTCHFTVKFNKY